MGARPDPHPTRSDASTSRVRSARRSRRANGTAITPSPRLRPRRSPSSSRCEARWLPSVADVDEAENEVIPRIQLDLRTVPHSPDHHLLGERDVTDILLVDPLDLREQSPPLVRVHLDLRLLHQVLD